MNIYNPYYVLEPYDLQHHGILGQKWGIRRFQNKDGSLTQAGKARYDTETEEEHKARKDKALKSGNASDVMEFKKELTDQELRNVLNRINMEHQLSKYAFEESKANKVSTKFDKAIGDIEHAAAQVKKITTWTVAGVVTYNTIAKHYNKTPSGIAKPWPVINKETITEKVAKMQGKGK